MTLRTARFIGILSLVLLAACSKPFELKKPYKVGQYRVAYIDIQVSDTGFVEGGFDKLKPKLVANLISKLAGRGTTPEVGVSIIVDKAFLDPTFTDSEITGKLLIWEPKTKEKLGEREIAYTDSQQGASTPVPGGIAGAIAYSVGKFVGGAIARSSDDEQEERVIEGFSTTVINIVYPPTNN